MLRCVLPALVFGAVAITFFLVGVRLEPMFDGPRRERPAEARGLAEAPALRLAKQAPLNSGANHKDAIQSGVVPLPSAAAVTPAAPAPGPAAEAIEKPSTVSGTDPDSDTNFVEMKNLPEVAGQAEGNIAEARDVDMIGEQGVPVPDQTNATTDSASSGKSDN